MLGLNVKLQRNAILAKGCTSQCPQIAIKVTSQMLSSASPRRGW